MTPCIRRFPKAALRGLRRFSLLASLLPLALVSAAHAQQGDAALILTPVALTCLAQDADYARLPLGRALSERVQTAQPGVLSAFAACLKGRKLFSSALCTELLSQNPQAAPNAGPLLEKYGSEIARVEELRACPPADPAPK
jgi:hypothetical protein